MCGYADVRMCGCADVRMCGCADINLKSFAHLKFAHPRIWFSIPEINKISPKLIFSGLLLALANMYWMARLLLFQKSQSWLMTVVT